MSRRQIIPKTVDGFTVTELDVRIVSMPLYPMTDTVVNVFYGYYSNNKRIGTEGNLQLEDLISSDSKTALLDALTAQVGVVTEATLLLHQVKDGYFSIKYKKSDGTENRVKLTGSYFTSSEYSSIISAVMTATSSYINEWAFRKKITVSSTSSQTNYPVSLTIHNTTGTDTNSDVYIGSNVRSDWGDIRIVANDLTTKIPFAIIKKDSANILITFSAPSLINGDTYFYLYYNKPKTKTNYKIACLTDTHYDPGTTSLNRQYTLDYIDNFVARMATYLPDLAVNNGDKIGESNNTIANETTRLAWYQANMDHFVPVRTYAGVTRDGVAMGNHDVEAMYFPDVLAKHSAETWMESGVMYGYWESTDFRFISLDANYKPSDDTHLTNVNQGYGYIDATQRTWLINALASSTKPVIIFCHQPLCEMETGVLGIDKATYHTQNRAAIRTILETSGKVICVLHGHMHWHRYDVINGIPYIVMEDISEGRSDEAPSGTSGKWSLIEIDTEAKIIDFKLEAKVGASYITVHEHIIPYKTSFDDDIANFHEKVFELGDAATYGKASILSDASQLYMNSYTNILAMPHNNYLSDPYISDRGITITGVTNSPSYGKGQFYFAPQTGYFKIKILARLDTLKSKFFKVGNGSGADTAPGPYVGFLTAGNIFAQNGGTNTSLQAYSINTWYEIEIQVNTAAKTYNVIIDGVTKASGFAFYSSSPSTLSQLQIQTETGNLYLNNLRIEPYTPNEPSITAVGSEENI